MFRAIIAAIPAVLISGCAWFTFPTDAQIREMARDYDPDPVSEAEAIASYNFLNNPPPGCEDDPVCKSDRIWATHRINEYERSRRNQER